MALPLILSGLTKAAANPEVQAGAARLFENVYGRILNRPGKTVDGGTPPSREEVAAAFALLQSDLDRKNRMTGLWIAAIALLQIIAICLLVFRG